MSNLKNQGGRPLSALLGLAASKLGTDPSSLERMIKSGRTDQLAGSLPPDQQEKLKAALADPETAKKVLSSPQARSLMEKLKKK